MYVINHEQVVIVPRKKIRMTFIITLTVLCYFGFGSAFLQKFDGLSRRTFALPLRRRFFDRGDTTMPTVTTLINENIKSDPVRLSAPKPDGEEGEEIKLGIYSLSEALKLAAEMQLDLIMINPKIEPAICKIADYGKFKFNNDKKKREHSAKQKQTTLKELKSSFKVDQHDFDVRVRAARKALSEGDRVCFTNFLLSIMVIINFF